MPRIAGLAVLVTAIVCALAAAPAMAATSCNPSPPAPLAGTGFEGADGDACDSDGTGTGVFDWNTMAGVVGIEDGTPDSIFGSGSKENDPLSFTAITGNATPKTDALVAWGVNDPLNDLFLYLSFSRVNDTGDTHLAYEFNQAGPGANAPFPDRSNGDVLVGYDIDTTDRITVSMCTWKWRDDADHTLQGDWMSLPSDPRNIGGVPFPITPTEKHCTELNALTTPAAQGAVNLHGDIDFQGDTIEQGKFAEASVNLTAALANAEPTPCTSFAYMWLHTRASDTITSDPKDFILPEDGIDLGTCDIDVDKQVSDDGTTWYDADTEGDALVVDVRDDPTFSYRSVVTLGNGVVPLTVDFNDPNCPHSDTPDSGDGGTIGLLERDEEWVYNCTRDPSDGETSFENVASATGTATQSGNSAQVGPVSDSAWTVITHPDISVVKSGTAVAHHGDTLSFSFLVTNTGDTQLTGVTVSDDKCPNVTGGDDVLDPDEETTFTCSYKLGDHVGAPNSQESVQNLATAQGTPPAGPNVSATSPHTTRVIHPGIDVQKDVAEEIATPGDTLHYTIKVTNTGDTDLDVSPSDLGCEGFDGSGFSLAAGDSKTLTCTHVLAGDSYTNEACASGVDVAGGTVSDCDDATTKTQPASLSGVKFNDADGNGQRGEGEGPLAGFTFYVDYDGNGALDAGEPAAVSADDGSWTIAGINPGTWKVREQAVAGFTCTAPNPCEYDVTLRSGDAQTGKDFGNQAPAQLVLPERITPGAARLIAPTGCASKVFNARVRGSKIARVVFILDGKTVKTLRKPNSGKLFSVRVDPGKLRVGVHRIVAAITFQAGSGTRPKRQTISFQRCARKLQAPRFTG